MKLSIAGLRTKLEPSFRSFLPAGLAVALFVPLFFFREIGPFDFWLWMSANLLILLVSSFFIDGNFLRPVILEFRSLTVRKVGQGVVSAGFLYFIFWAGKKISLRLFSFAAAGIQNVYGFKGSASWLRIALLMAILIGPGEELFWRGFLQRRWQERFGATAGWLMTTGLYAAVHLGSGNPMLVLAAGVCGLFWGYLFLRTKSLLLVAVSHTVWDLLVFMVFPF